VECGRLNETLRPRISGTGEPDELDLARLRELAQDDIVKP
jgi:hypothetical protein